ncbi:MAG: endonuclease/exonuclease/phosphatase family protein [Myxococcaceae bacterium]|nr:endonuclease/exonuclease/phosphatase family protein [Myxococcaceae bacterium]
MRLVSYNVRYFGHGLKGLASTAGSKQGIAQALASLDPLPDVVALQEVETRSIRSLVAHAAAHDAETQLEAFVRHLDGALDAAKRGARYDALYFPAHSYRAGPVVLYTTGLAVLLRRGHVQRLSDNSRAPHEITFRKSERLRTVKQTRIAAHVHLEGAHGERFFLFNTHLSLPTFWAKEFWSQADKMGFGKNQLHEARTLGEYVRHASHGEPFLVVGDFNSPPSTPVYEHLTRDEGLIGAQEVLRLIDPLDRKGFASAGFMNLRMHLDHVFGGNGMSFADMNDTHAFGLKGGRFSGLSDHVPLLATFDPGRSRR